MHCHWDTAARLTLLNAMVPKLEFLQKRLGRSATA